MTPRNSPDRKPAVKVTDDMWRDALKLHNGGLSWDMIGLRMNVTGRALRKRYQWETGTASKPKRRMVNKVITEMILDMRAEGAVVREIERATGFGLFAIQRELREARDRGDPRAAYREGATCNTGSPLITPPFVPAPYVEPPPPPTDRLVLSLMMRGMSHVKAHEAAAAHRRRDVRMEASA